MISSIMYKSVYFVQIWQKPTAWFHIFLIGLDGISPSHSAGNSIAENTISTIPELIHRAVMVEILETIFYGLCMMSLSVALVIVLGNWL